jgi:hypothetical protein
LVLIGEEWYLGVMPPLFLPVALCLFISNFVQTKAFISSLFMFGIVNYRFFLEKSLSLG